MDFRSIHPVETPEHLRLDLELSGLASRVFAFTLDFGVMGLLAGLLMALLYLLTAWRHLPQIASTGSPLVVFGITFFYHILSEWLWNGKTVGKTMMRIRVVRGNGQPVGFWEAFGRNLLRVVDVYLGGMGLLCMMFNRSEKRLGDFLAGTVVISDQPVAKPGRFQPETLPEDSMPPADRLPFRLTPEEAELLRAYQARREALFPGATPPLREALCRYFAERWHQPVSTDADLDAGLQAGQRDARLS